MPRHGLRRETVELDKQVWEWRLGIPKVTKRMTQEFAKKLFADAGISAFKASDGWYRRWQKRWKDESFQKNSSKTVKTITHNITAERLFEKINPNLNNLDKDTGPVLDKDFRENFDKNCVRSELTVFRNDNNTTNQKLNLANNEIKSKLGISKLNNLNDKVISDAVIFKLDTSVRNSLSDGNVNLGLVSNKTGQGNEVESSEICLNVNERFDKPEDLCKNFAKSLENSENALLRNDDNVIKQKLNYYPSEIKSAVETNNLNNLSDKVVTASNDVVLKLDTRARNSVSDDNVNTGLISKETAQDNAVESSEICLNFYKEVDKPNGNCLVNCNSNENSVYSSLNSVNNITYGFHTPTFNLSSEIFDNYNFLGSGDGIFCKNCGDFHIDDFRCNKLFFNDDGKNDECEGNNRGYDDFNSSYKNKINVLLKNDKIDNFSSLNFMMSTKSSLDNQGVSSAVLNNSLSVNKVTKFSDGSDDCDGDNSDLIPSNNSGDILRRRKKGERYLPHFKAKVIAHAKMHTIKSAADKFNVAKCTVSEWIRAKMRVNDNGRFNLSQRSSEDTSEKVFIRWLGEMRREQRLLNKKFIRDKLCEIIDKDKSERHAFKKSSWLLLYFERLKSSLILKEQKEVTVIQKGHITYPVEFKLEVAIYAKTSSQLAAARAFYISRKRVFEWLEIVKTQGTIKNPKVPGMPSSYVTDAVVDQEIWAWYSSQTTKPTSFEVREMGRKLYKEKGYNVICSFGWFYRWRKRFRLLPPETIDFLLLEWILGELDKNQYISHLDLLEYAISLQHASLIKVTMGWAIRFCKRYTSLLQKMPTIDTALPPNMEINVVNFRRRIKELKNNLGLGLDDIGTVDEISLHFIHSDVKKKDLLIRRPGFENCQASVVLASLANGQLLPPIVVLKGTCDISLPLTRNLFVFRRKDGCVDNEIMSFWLKHVWFRFQNGVCLLVTDHYSPHTHPSIQEIMSKSLCHHELFPSGCSCKLQPLGISLCNLFKEKIEKRWRNKVECSLWDHNRSETYIKVPSDEDILTWVVQAHQEISFSQKEELEMAFQKTLFSENSGCDEKLISSGTNL